MTKAFVAAIAVLGSCSWAFAQSVERTARGPADKDIRIGVYINVRPDCSSGPLPSIRLSTPPTNGKVTVKSSLGGSASKAVTLK